MVHIFVCVVRSSTDPFAGIKQALSEEPGSRILEVSLTPAELDRVHRVEYSDRKYVRFIYYREIFAQFTKRLVAALDGLQGEPAAVYFSDEGVWAVLWMRIRGRYRRGQVTAVNVQHGFAELRTRPFLVARKIINYFATLITGYPFLGMGSLAGAGPEAFDVYVTYDQPTADFIRARSGSRALPCPRLIKAQLIEAYREQRQKVSNRADYVLFALQKKFKGSPVRCDVGAILDQLLSVAQTLAEFGTRLRIRLHPGMDQNAEKKRFADHPIAKWAELDEHRELHDSIAEARVVMAYCSTVLWEAGLLGLLPVQVLCSCCDFVRLNYPCEVLDLDKDIRPALFDILQKARRPILGDARDLVAAEWASLTREINQL